MGKAVPALKEAILAAFPAVGTEYVHAPQGGLYLGVQREPYPRTPSLYPGSICFLAQGSKAVYLGSFQCNYDPGHFLLSRYNVVADSASPDASPRKPLVGMAIDLSLTRLGQVIAEIGPEPIEGSELAEQPALTTHPMDQALVDVLVRVVDASRDDTEWRVLSEGLLRELYFRLVRGPAAPLLRARAASVGSGSQVAAAIEYIQRNLTDAVSTESIARAAGVSVSGLHAKFKRVTGQAPMQFVKRLRLDRARTLLVSGQSVTEASLGSGYNSMSQFSREFRREYGTPPSQLRTQ